MTTAVATGSNYRSFVVKPIDVTRDTKPKVLPPERLFEKSIVWNSIVYNIDRLAARVLVASQLALSPATAKLVTRYMDIGEVLRSELRLSWREHCQENPEDGHKVSEWQEEAMLSSVMCRLLTLHQRRITRLDLSHIPITAAILHEVAKRCPNVQHLFLKGCMITDNITPLLQAVACFTNLTGLDLSHNCFMDQAAQKLLAPLESLQKLKWLNLTKTVDRDGDGLAVDDMRSLARLPQLTKLLLNGNPRIGEETEDADVFVAMRALERLSLNDCPDIKQDFAARLRAKRPGLTIELVNSGPRAD